MRRRSLWRRSGDLALQARASWVQLAAGSDLFLAEALSRQAAALHQEVAGESPSPLERLLAEQVVIGWLQVNYYNCLLAQKRREYTPPQSRLLQQHDAAQRRYLAAIKMLATIRKLVPARSPVEIAGRYAGGRSRLRLHEAPLPAGVPVVN